MDPLRFLESVTDEYGPVVGLLLGTERVVLVTSREAARQVQGRICRMNKCVTWTWGDEMCDKALFGA